MIRLAFPENVEVKVLIDYVSKRLGMNILYDEAVGKKRVTIYAPARIPKSSLLGLFQSILKMSGMVLVDAEQPGWKKVVQNQDLLAITETIQRTNQQLKGAEAATVVTQIFRLQNATVGTVEQTIKPFLSKPGGNSLTIADQNILIVTDFAGSLRRISQLIELLDKPKVKVSFRLVQAKNLEASELARQAGEYLKQKDKMAAGATGKTAEGELVLTADARTNRVVVISTEGAEQQALDLIEMLDVPLKAETHSYRFQHIAPQRIDQLAREFAGPDQAKSRYKSVIVPESGLLVVTAPADLQEKISALARELDVAQAETQQSNVRFYKLMNATAASVMATIRSLTSSDVDLSELASEAPKPSSDVTRYSGPNNPPPPAGQQPPKPPTYHAAAEPASQPAGAGQGQPSLTTAKTKDALITADTNTNTLIVVAPPAVQGVYKQLIAMLDKRRPQVMVEVILVTLDTTDDLSLGVELSKPDTHSPSKELVFSSFGLSKVDPLTGTLTPLGGTGFNGVILSPDNIDVVVRALATSGKAKVMSAPKVLVNDNASATLSSISESPFTSINASETVSTTSFAGYASAGTTINLTPHISEGDHLHLQYSVTLSSFTGSGGAGIPPPRQTNEINSEVVVPNGYTVVVGGLTRKDKSETANKIPLLGDIPILGYAFGMRDWKDSKSTLFAFIRPVILRDDEFEDLKYYSDKDLERAELPAELPQSQPMIVR